MPEAPPSCAWTCAKREGSPSWNSPKGESALQSIRVADGQREECRGWIASAGPEQFRQAVETVLAADEVDAVIVIYIPIETAATETVVDAVREGVAAGRKAGGSGKPVLACLMAEQGIRTQLILPDEQIPCFAFPEDAARVLVKASAYAAWRAQEPGKVLEFADIDLPLITDICQKGRKGTWRDVAFGRTDARRIDGHAAAGITGRGGETC